VSVNSPVDGPIGQAQLQVHPAKETSNSKSLISESHCTWLKLSQLIQRSEKS
jgi:hypothetical protein